MEVRKYLDGLLRMPWPIAMIAGLGPADAMQSTQDARPSALVEVHKQVRVVQVYWKARG